MLAAIGVAGIATIIGLGWMIYTCYEPRTQQTGLRLSQCLPPKMVNEAVVFRRGYPLAVARIPFSM